MLRFALSIPNNAQISDEYLKALAALFDSCLKLEISQENLLNLMMTIQSWSASSNSKNRQAAMHIWLTLLVQFNDYAHSLPKEQFKFGPVLIPAATIRSRGHFLLLRIFESF